MIRTFVGIPVLLCVAALGHAWMQECHESHWRFFALCVTLLVSAVALAVVAGASGKGTPAIPGTKRVSMEELRRTFTPMTPHGGTATTITKPPEAKP